MRQIMRKSRGIFIAGVLTAGLLGVAAQNAAGQQSATPPAPAPAAGSPAPTATPAPPADVAKQLDELKQRVAELEAQKTPPAPDNSNQIGGSGPTPDPEPDPQAAAAPAPQTPAATAAPAPPPVDNDTPFAFADFTWMLSNPRNHDEVLDGKYFSGEFRVDTNYMYDYNHPVDHTLIGTTEGERTGEFIIQALNIGGDFHAGNMQGRLLTQFGAVSTAVPRNDASYSQGQWDLLNAYRYLTEMYAGYHINVNHGLNLQVGDFLSFIGLFSYYSFDNWAYQPSYVSSNTPWFFTGMRAQWFPTNKLKFEPWLINGWQTYAKPNGREGVGGQILYRPNGNLDFVWNTYALGRDVLGNPHRSRYHADWSQEWKFYENPKKLMHRAGITITEDFGCETGGGVVCRHGNAATPAQNFLGIMAYNRYWFDNDKFGLTLGGGVVNNPGRYLVLLPPINGANATSGTPYFTENPGDPFKAYDFQITGDYMPSQWVTWRAEFTQRGSSVPYFAGAGGITPNQNGAGVYPGLYVNEGAPGSFVQGFTPDLVKQERRFIFSLMVKL